MYVLMTLSWYWNNNVIMHLSTNVFGQELVAATSYAVSAIVLPPKSAVTPYVVRHAATTQFLLHIYAHHYQVAAKSRRQILQIYIDFQANLAGI